MAEKKVGIVILTYNTPQLLLPQLNLVARYCRDKDITIEVVDNSTNEAAATSINYHAREFNKNTPFKVGYMRTRAKSYDSSVSATWALNVSFAKLSGIYDYFLYLDHDSFPVREFSVIEELGNNVMAGLGQQKAMMYYHTGHLMFSSEVERNLIDFGCNDEFKLDTGGNLYKVIEAYPDRCKFWDEVYEENPYFNQGFYNFYSMVNNGMFMHFINGSGWNKLEKARQDERINSLLNVLNEKVSGLSL